MNRARGKPQLVYKNRMERFNDRWWLIWSNKNGCWYRPESRGYTSDIAQAGLFTKDEAAMHYTPPKYPRSHRVTEPFPVSAVKRHVELCEREATAIFEKQMSGLGRLRAALASGIEARSDETAQQAQPKGCAKILQQNQGVSND